VTLALTSCLPKCLQPMSATLTYVPFDNAGWVLEERTTDLESA
jgi:hypothetical protein